MSDPQSAIRHSLLPNELDACAAIGIASGVVLDSNRRATTIESRDDGARR